MQYCTQIMLEKLWPGKRQRFCYVECYQFKMEIVVFFQPAPRPFFKITECGNRISFLNRSCWFVRIK